MLEVEKGRKVQLPLTPRVRLADDGRQKVKEEAKGYQLRTRADGWQDFLQKMRPEFIELLETVRHTCQRNKPFFVLANDADSRGIEDVGSETA